MLCCVALCCVVLSCIVLCCNALCCVVLFVCVSVFVYVYVYACVCVCVLLCFLCYVILYCVVLCCAMLHFAVLSCAVLSQANNGVGRRDARALFFLFFLPFHSRPRLIPYYWPSSHSKFSIEMTRDESGLLNRY